MKRLNVSSFDDAFRKIHKPPRSFVCPVGIILTYAYYFEHERYDWHIDVEDNLDDYNKRRLAPGFQLAPADILPDVHVTIHDKHYHRANRQNPLRQGYCVARRIVDQLPAGCEEYKDTVNFQLFEFSEDHHLDTWCKIKKRCTEMIKKHYQNVRKYYQGGLYDLNLQRVLNVERAAARDNIICPKIFDFP